MTTTHTYLVSATISWDDPSPARLVIAKLDTEEDLAERREQCDTRMKRIVAGKAAPLETEEYARVEQLGGKVTTISVRIFTGTYASVEAKGIEFFGVRYNAHLSCTLRGGKWEQRADESNGSGRVTSHHALSMHREQWTGSFRDSSSSAQTKARELLLEAARDWLNVHDKEVALANIEHLEGGLENADEKVLEAEKALVLAKRTRNDEWAVPLRIAQEEFAKLYTPKKKK